MPQASNVEPIRTRRQLNESCARDCYLRLFKNSHSLVEAVARMYETSKNSILFEKYEKQLRARANNKDNSMKNKKHHGGKVSMSGGGSDEHTLLNRNSTKTRKVSRQLKLKLLYYRN